MFLKSYTELRVEFADVRSAMCGPPYPWLAGLAGQAELDGRRLLVEVGLEIAGREVATTATLTVGTPVATDRTISLPIKLQFEDRERLFPSLEGSLDAAWLGEDRTYLALSAQYDPPFGALGRVVDRTLLHRVAESVAARLVQGAADRLAGAADGHLRAHAG